MSPVPLPQRLSHLAEAASALSGELELDAVLQTVVDVAAHVTDARYVALGVVGVNNAIVRFITHGMDEATINKIGNYPTGKGLLGLLIDQPQIIRTDDIAAHPASYGFPPEHPPMTTFLGAPVRLGGRVYGNLYLTEKDGGFTTTDEQVLAVLASQAGAAIENALLSARLRELAVHEERERISRELHDGAIQMLFSVGMGLQTARALVDVQPDAAAQRIDTAIDGVDQTIRDLRGAIFKLQANDAASLGMVKGLAELAREHEVNALVRPRLTVPSDLDARVPSALVPDILAIVREALSNAAKHARARNVTIEVAIDGLQLQLAVTDDGIGFAVEQPTAGRGLENMQERVAGMGGTWQVDSTPGEGTTMRIALPMEPA